MSIEPQKQTELLEKLVLQLSDVLLYVLGMHKEADGSCALTIFSMEDASGIVRLGIAGLLENVRAKMGEIESEPIYSKDPETVSRLEQEKRTQLERLEKQFRLLEKLHALWRAGALPLFWELPKPWANRIPVGFLRFREEKDGHFVVEFRRKDGTVCGVRVPNGQMNWDAAWGKEELVKIEMALVRKGEGMGHQKPKLDRETAMIYARGPELYAMYCRGQNPDALFENPSAMDVSVYHKGLGKLWESLTQDTRHRFEELGRELHEKPFGLFTDILWQSAGDTILRQEEVALHEKKLGRRLTEEELDEHRGVDIFVGGFSLRCLQRLFEVLDPFIIQESLTPHFLDKYLLKRLKDREVRLPQDKQTAKKVLYIDFLPKATADRLIELVRHRCKQNGLNDTSDNLAKVEEEMQIPLPYEYIENLDDSDYSRQRVREHAKSILTPWLDEHERRIMDSILPLPSNDGKVREADAVRAAAESFLESRRRKSWRNISVVPRPFARKAVGENLPELKGRERADAINRVRGKAATLARRLVMKK